MLVTPGRSPLLAALGPSPSPAGPPTGTPPRLGSAGRGPHQGFDLGQYMASSPSLAYVPQGFGGQAMSQFAPFGQNFQASVSGSRPVGMMRRLRSF